MLVGAMSQTLSASPAGSATGRGINLVLVDDSPLVLSSLAHLLRRSLPLQIAAQAENGLEGFALAAELQPDLVIADVRMPGLGGLQFVKLLRYHYPAIRSILTSTHDGATLRAACLRHGADAFITKQRLPDELPPLLKRLFLETPKSPIQICKP